MEILIEHYEYGMELSLPLVVGDKTLLDAGNSIENDKMMEIIKANGVKKIDIKRKYLAKVAEKYPEFYKFEMNQVESAQELIKGRREEALNFVKQTRKLYPKPPCIWVCCSLDLAPDLRKVLSLYFSIEKVSDKLKEMIQSSTRANIVLIYSDDFVDGRIQEFIKDLQKHDNKIKVIIVFKKAPESQYDNMVQWRDDGLYVLRAAYFALYPERYKELGSPQLKGVRVKGLEFKQVQIFCQQKLLPEIDQLKAELPQLDISSCNLEKIKRNPLSNIFVLRIENKAKELVLELKKLKDQGVHFSTLLIILSTISKEEIELLKPLGKLSIVLGDLMNEKCLERLRKLLG